MKQTNGMRCPWCGRRKSVVAEGETFYCTACSRRFDSDPNEGGDYFSDPSKRLERSEEKRSGGYNWRRYG